MSDLACREVVEIVTDYLEGRMRGRTRQRFEAHLGACPHCREYVAQVKAIIDAAGEVLPEDLAPSTRTGLIDMYREWRAEGA